ncbi:hypothetical protein FNH22_28675 [Fulvivirga sp. M361]|uniref:hypothetical protein n=1 Tax=Fulvivirga sp. M361 TaxID=2594266 RepID=UPI00117B3D28|nr:hypothetical protein [Fulvivirga sp. M361]TRX48572.1 hypothetical protein FNH22_28675 [Fulvivirga sp. M361]
MKSIKKWTYLLNAGVLLAVFTLIGCGKDDDGPSASEVLLSELSAKKWTVEKVMRDNTEVTSEFSGFTFSFTKEGKYETENGGLAWEAEGTLILQEDSSDTFTRDDDVVVKITIQEGSALTMAFTISENVHSGRTTSLKGVYSFELK